jgi:hypothetical protein
LTFSCEGEVQDPDLRALPRSPVDLDKSFKTTAPFEARCPTGLHLEFSQPTNSFIEFNECGMLV